MRLRTSVAVAVLCLAVFGSSAMSYAQGVQTGTLRGMVKDQQDLPVPGVTVTITSPALQGERTAVTDNQGGYVFAGLPAGNYAIKFELQGFNTVTQESSVPLGNTADVSVTLRTGGLTEAVNVVGATPGPIATAAVGANYKQRDIEALATPRSLTGIAQLAPALTENSPNAGQLVINGAFAFDNVLMVNGVDVNDNLFANARTLFIEDAIQETQVLTSGISAEYGRFSGGVVNAITKSGGNNFSGSFRVNFLNPSWTTQTPFELSRPTPITHLDKVSRIYESTFGGPIAKDRLWFFLAGRYASVGTSLTLPQTGVGIIQDDTDKRGEIKLTGTIVDGHVVSGGFLNDPRTVTNTSGLLSFVIDPHSLTDRNFPNKYFYTNYKGVLGNDLLIEAQYSAREFEFGAEGPDGSDLVLHSPFISVNQCACLYNAPYFASQLDPENRNNAQMTGSVSKYWSKSGRHETKGGYEWFRSQRKGGNSQSPTQYVFNSDFLTTASGAVVLDSTGRPIPVFVPGDSSLDFYPAVIGATMNVDNNSIYLQDHWTINSKLSADLGLRYEHVTTVSTGDITSIDTSRIVPRLALGYDPKGDGRQTVHVSYAQYSGRYNEAQVGKNSPVGNPPDVTATYLGPAGQGYNFAPGTNLANYPINAQNASASDPTKNVFMTDGTQSALVHEFSLSYGTTMAGNKAYGEITYVGRKTTGMVEDFQRLSDGSTLVIVNGVPAGRFTNTVYENTDDANRSYQGMVFQGRYRIRTNWDFAGHYTLQIKNDGNYEGEGSNLPGNTSFMGNYPEAFNAARNFPDGRLQDFQRSRMRLWSIYNWNMGRAGTASLSGLWRVESARVYSLAARNQAITAQQRTIIQNAGYVDLPSSTQNGGNMVYFGERGSEEFAGYGAFDTSINYDIPVFRTLRPWVKFDVYNLFDNKKLIAFGTTVSQNRTAGAPLDNLGLATTYTPAATFGTATGNTVTNLYSTGINTFPLAFSGATAGGRTIRVAVGLRF